MVLRHRYPDTFGVVAQAVQSDPGNNTQGFDYTRFDDNCMMEAWGIGPLFCWLFASQHFYGMLAQIIRAFEANGNSV